MSLKNPQGSGRIMMANNRIHHTVNSSNILNNNSTNNNNNVININAGGFLASTNAAANNRNITTLNNIERLLDESTSTFRHKKMLQNIVNVVKASELLDEYRQMVRHLQNSCVCKKSKNIVEQIGHLEKRYQEYCTSSESKGLSIDTNHGQIGGTLSSPIGVPINSNKVLVTQKLVNQSGKTVAYTTTASANSSKSPVLNFTLFNQSLKNNSNNRQMLDDSNNNNSSKLHANNNNIIISSINSPNNNNSTIINSNNNAGFVSRNNVGKTYIEYNYNRNTVNDKIPILEEQIEDEPEEEYDIAEYMILAEMLEREKNKLVRERDPKNEYIVVVRDTSTKDTICYECIVGGKCGFLSRERSQMLFHLSKHFENENQSSEEDEDEDSKEDVDISIIPVNPEDILHDDKASPLPYKQNADVSEKLLAQQLKMQLMALQQEQDNEQNSSSEQAGYKRLIYCTWANCSFNCDQNYKLRTHIRQVHQKLRPYLCDWPGCYGAYKTRSNLASHRMVHTGERPFICDYPDCGAKFARKYDCERHRRIHCEKMYACEWPGCGKRLCDPYNLERHMMVHKGELPYRCPIGKCIRGFRELRYLRDHMVNAHQCLPDTVQLKMAYMKSSPNNESESDKNSCEDNDVEETSIVKKLLVSGTNNNSPAVQQQQPATTTAATANTSASPKKTVSTVARPATKRQISAITNKATTSKNVVTIDSELEYDEEKEDELQRATLDDNNNVDPVQVKQEIVEEPKSGKRTAPVETSDKTNNNKDDDSGKAQKTDAASDSKKDDHKASPPVSAMSTRRSKRVRNK